MSDVANEIPRNITKSRRHRGQYIYIYPAGPKGNIDRLARTSVSENRLQSHCHFEQRDLEICMSCKQYILLMESWEYLLRRYSTKDKSCEWPTTYIYLYTITAQADCKSHLYEMAEIRSPVTSQGALRTQHICKYIYIYRDTLVQISMHM